MECLPFTITVLFGPISSHLKHRATKLNWYQKAPDAKLHYIGRECLSKYLHRHDNFSFVNCVCGLWGLQHEENDANHLLK